jgi:hypothetical protein
MPRFTPHAIVLPSRAPLTSLTPTRAQHVTGGMQHWLFDKDVLEDLDII